MNAYDWIDMGNGRKVYRKIGPMCLGPRSELACPQIVKPFAEPVQSMADGKFYSNPRDLEKTYKPSGNPRGEEFIQLGNERLKTVEHTADPKQRREDIKQAVRSVLAGDMTPEIAAIQ